MPNDKTNGNEDWTNRPEHLRQIAAELDGDRKTPCTQAAICREAADEIEALRSGRAMTNPDTTLETLVREWRDSREEWFAWEHWGETKWKKMPKAQSDIITRLGKAENDLMFFARSSL